MPHVRGFYRVADSRATSTSTRTVIHAEVRSLRTEGSTRPATITAITRQDEGATKA